MTMGSPRVFDGTDYVDVHEIIGTAPAPMEDGDGSIFVSIASYRGKHQLKRERMTLYFCRFVANYYYCSFRQPSLRRNP
jgi:TPP-dependent pyruvate/acetoin dehydrogenase alpha subunit